MSRRSLPGWAVTFALALLIAIGAFLSADEPSPEPEKPKTVTETLNGPQAGVQKVEAPVAEIRKAGDLNDHDHLRGEVPEGVPIEDIILAQQQQEELAASDQLPLVTPDAAPEQRGCVTRLVQNFSTRRGVRPRLWVLHYTVSPNRPGWGDVNAVVSLFDRPSFAASSHYVIDAEGHCAYIVRESDKSWTQAAANPISISVEIINSGKEKTYAGTAGMKKLGRVISDSAKRWDIPLQRGAVSGCSVARAGIVDHRSLGACGGGHVDIEPPFSVAEVITAAKRARASDPSAQLVQARRSHRIVHAQIRSRCRGAARRSNGCRILFARNGALHNRWKERLS